MSSECLRVYRRIKTFPRSLSIWCVLKLLIHNPYYPPPASPPPPPPIQLDGTSPKSNVEETHRYVGQLNCRFQLNSVGWNIKSQLCIWVSAVNEFNWWGGEGDENEFGAFSVGFFQPFPTVSLEALFRIPSGSFLWQVLVKRNRQSPRRSSTWPCSVGHLITPRPGPMQIEPSISTSLDQIYSEILFVSSSWMLHWVGTAFPTCGRSAVTCRWNAVSRYDTHLNELKYIIFFVLTPRWRGWTGGGGLEPQKLVKPSEGGGGRKKIEKLTFKWRHQVGFLSLFCFGVVITSFFYN